MAEAAKGTVFTIIVLLLILFLVALSVRSIIKNRKSGKKTCGGSCAGCPMGGNCETKEAEK